MNLTDSEDYYMKRFGLVLVLIFIFGVSCGGIYQLTFGGGKLAFPVFITESIEKFEDRQAAKKAQKEEEHRRCRCGFFDFRGLFGFPWAVKQFTQTGCQKQSAEALF